MTLLNNLLHSIQQPLQLGIAVILFTRPLPKRNHWILYLCSSVILSYIPIFLAMLLFYRLPFANYSVTILWSLGWFLATMIGTHAVYQIQDLHLSMYIATLAYLTQHIAFCIWDALFPGACYSELDLSDFSSTANGLVIPFLIFAVVYLLVYFFVSRPISQNGLISVGRGRSVSIMLAVLVISIIFSAVIQNDFESHRFLYSCCRIYATLCCSIMLLGQVDLHDRLAQQEELTLQRQLWLRHKAQYQRATNSVKIINHRCHALKLQVAKLRELTAATSSNTEQKMLQELEDSVSSYDSIIETGNEILDTILTEKSLLCSATGITFTCVADGKAVRFLEAIDLFSMLGNALDNAEEAVRLLDDPEKRTISVSIFSGRGVAVLQVENFFSGQLVFKDGLPLTTKGDPDYHGFGLKSIRSTAQKYGGAISIHAENDIFLLRITLPLETL